MSCLYCDFSTYRRDFSNNIRLSPKKTPTGEIGQFSGILPLVLRLRNCVQNLNVDPLIRFTVLHPCFDDMKGFSSQPTDLAHGLDIVVFVFLFQSFKETLHHCDEWRR